MMQKILTVAVPSYNVEQYLDRGLSTYADDRLKETLEVLIVNDGSTDGTAAVAQKYVDRYPEIFRLINKENGGHGSAVNAGIDQARGKYFRVVDGDDGVHTENLIRLIERMKDLESDLIVDEKREVQMVSGETRLFPIPDYAEKDRELKFEAICDREDIGSFIMIHTLSVRTELLQKADIHLLEHVFYVDYEYIVKATCLADTITFLGLEIYQYLVGNVNQSVSARNYVRRISHHEAVTREMLRFEGEQTFTGARRAYLERKVQLIIHTHYNIALIFNQNRREGVIQARQFRRFLLREYPKFEQRTRKRFHEALALHYLGVDAEKLDRLMRRRS